MRTSIRVRSVAVAIGIVICSEAAWAQKTGGPPPTGRGTTHGPPSNNPLPNMTGRSDGPALGSLNGSIYLTGNVMLDDGNPPADPVTIERVCNGTPRAQAYTDRKGRFSAQVAVGKLHIGRAGQPRLLAQPTGKAGRRIQYWLVFAPIVSPSGHVASSTTRTPARSCYTGWPMWRDRRSA